MSAPAEGRQLSLADCVAIGINGIVGSGVYFLMAPMARKAGGASVLGIAACGALCILIALCYAELAGMFDRSGGSYVYARAAFGPYVGFGVGWMSTVTGVIAYAAVASGFSQALATLVPALSVPLVSSGGFSFRPTALVSVALICALGSINYRGMKAGARTVDVLSVLKVAPLVLLALVGLWVARATGPGLLQTASGPEAAAGLTSAVGGAAFLAVFMMSGFEFTAVPAGATKDARRNVPIAIVGSVVGATVLYCALQWAGLQLLPDLGALEQPVPAMAGALFGEVGRQGVEALGLISMVAFCAGSALVAPQYFTALSADGYLPGPLTRLTRFQTPGPAIALTTLLASVLSVVLTYSSLVDITNVVMFAQYLPVTLAVIALRIRQPDAPRRYRLPGGVAIPAVAAVFTGVLFVVGGPAREEWVTSAQLLAIGFGVWGATVIARRSR